MMDITFLLFLRQGPVSVLCEPSMDLNRAEAFQWACTHPPALDSLGWRIIPLSTNGSWSFIVEEFHGPDTDR